MENKDKIVFKPLRLTSLRDTESTISMMIARREGDHYNVAEYNYQGIRHYVVSPLDCTHLDPIQLMHRCDFFELNFVREGPAKMLIEYSSCERAPGDILFFNRRVRHMEADAGTLYYLPLTEEFFNTWPSEISHFSQQRSAIWRFVANNKDDSISKQLEYMIFRFVGSPEDFQLIIEIFFNIEREFSQRGPGYKLIIYGLISRLFSLMEDPKIYHLESVNLGSSEEVSVAEEVQKLILASKGHISRTELSQRLNYNSDYLNRVFRRYMNVSIKVYCERVALDEVCQLLIETNESISAILSKMGISNKTQFYKIFFEQYGMTPQQFRDCH